MVGTKQCKVCFIYIIIAHSGISIQNPENATLLVTTAQSNNLISDFVIHDLFR